MTSLFNIVSVLCVFSVCEGAKVLLVSFDGFRWDYLTKYRDETKWFNHLRDIGGSTTDGSITGTFASLTFPSHFTIVTGLFQESHGIVANTMYDTSAEKKFISSNKESVRDPFWWKAATPIWISARQQGKRSATFYWPGSETTYHNMTQNYFKYYNQSTPYNDRVDTVVQWFLEDVDFVTLYFNEPDTAGHTGGPDSSQVRDALIKVDKTLEYLIDKLKSVNLFDKVNLIVVSDHGMAQCTRSTIIHLYEYLENKKDLYVRIVNSDGPVVHIIPSPNKEDELHEYLSGLVANKTINNITVYKRENIPTRFHYRHYPDRIQKIVLVADLGYYIAAIRSDFQIPPVFGAHGYDNENSQMRPIFMAHGPNIKPVKVKPFRQVDIYPLIMRLLDIKPTPNNGSWDNVSSIYKSSACTIPSRPIFTTIVAVSLILSRL